jgi:hypothetical protein
VHGDDTTVPVLAKGKTRTGRFWTYVRDDRPFGGLDPPAAVFFYSRDRTGDHPERHLDGYAGILQADAYAGFNRLYAGDRRRQARCCIRPCKIVGGHPEMKAFGSNPGSKRPPDTPGQD